MESSQQHSDLPTQLLMALGQMLEGMAAMQRDQSEANRQLLGALLAQAERQMKALDRLAARTAATPPNPSPLAGVEVTKMTTADNVQSFLETFEVTAEACGWPAVEWAVRLLPLLTGEAQTAALSLSPAARHNYAAVRKAVIDRLGLTPQDHQRRFREATLGPKDRPFTYAHQLKDAATRWLQPGNSGGAQAAVEKVVREQFVEGLPTGTAEWVRCHGPTSLEAAIALAEDHLAVHPGGQVDSSLAPDSPTRPLTRPIQAPANTGTLPNPQTDASNRGLGAVLSQQVEGFDRPVLYISRKLSERERRYSTVEKECLAIRWAVDSLRYYLLGRSFTLWSDHAPLQWLHRMKDTNARITRWYLALQPFNFKVIHRPGTQMVVADFLSRSHGGEGE
ncbi:uncharacterized protein LOC130198493 [Pseudoliparis swirei]|uniref:uncharacterized protein LOC130198493 n=1 Tax=Pseudoliparis swirei TaxID=2059687 RepID=UPI0024BD700F|nr:uncharacterized protein LOC130198493 [Pseudoliparis swirei]